MYLGLDLGTSGVKALLIDARSGDRRLRPTARSTSRVRIPAGRSRIRPHWIRATEEAVGKLKRSHGTELAAVKGIGLSGQMHGATLIDAQRQGAAALHPVERHAQPRRGRRSSTPIRDFRHAHRQHRLSRLHRAEARVGEEQRARRSSSRCARCCCRRTISAVADRRVHFGNVGFGRHVLARRRASAPGRRNCSPRPILDEQHMPALVEGTEPGGTLRAELAGAMGHGRRRGRRRRRRRQCGLGLRHGHGRAGRGLRVARHVGRAVCRQRRLSAQSRKRRAHLLPCAARMPGTRWASSCRRRIR